MAADSCVTITESFPDGSEQKSYRNKDQKIFQLGERNIGISWCGNAHVGNQGVEDYLDELDSRITPDSSVKNIAITINEDYKKRVTDEKIRCQVAGYECGEQSLYQIANDTVTLKNLNPDTKKKVTEFSIAINRGTTCNHRQCRSPRFKKIGIVEF